MPGRIKTIIDNLLKKNSMAFPEQRKSEGG